jgi:hypothetical protein
MTLDELIAAATDRGAQLGGDAPVYMMTRGGYAPVLLTDSVGFAEDAGADTSPIVLVAPGRGDKRIAMTDEAISRQITIASRSETTRGWCWMAGQCGPCAPSRC